jgi:DNA polymerase III subunit alpha
VVVKARVDGREEQSKLVCLELRALDVGSGQGTAELHLRLPIHALSDACVDQLKQLLVAHPGCSPVYLHLSQKVLRLPRSFDVDLGNALLSEVKVLLGADAVVG